MKLEELEKRLKIEPDNLGLRVQVAGLMREAGRSIEAVELYRSVALAYRDQGRAQQAIAVCRSILEIAPDDAACQGLLAMLQGLAQSDADGNANHPSRSSSLDETPLPRPIPYHVSDPTSHPVKVSIAELELTSASQVGPKTGLAEAARRISGMITDAGAAIPGMPTTEVDLSAELETRQRPKLQSEQIRKIERLQTPAPSSSDLDDMTTPHPLEDLGADEDLVTQPHDALTPSPRDSDEELTKPRDKLGLDDDHE